MFNNTPVNGYLAEMSCQAAGGHLVSFTSAEQQRELEQGFMASGAACIHFLAVLRCSAIMHTA